MKNPRLLAALGINLVWMFVQPAVASIEVVYYRLSPTEREQVTQEQGKWDKFKTHLIKAQSAATREAVDKLKLDGLTRGQRMEKIDAAIAKSRNPAQFNLEKDWHIIGYLLTGDAKIKEEHLTNAPLHNLIFGGLKTSVKTGYGPVRYFDARLVAETAAALAGADRKAIAARFDPAAMKKLGIYAPPEPTEKEVFLWVIEELTAYFQKAAAAHEEVILFAW